MKRITRTLVIATLASTATAAIAEGTPFPSSSPETVSLSEVFPNMATHQARHGQNPMQAANPLTVPYSVGNTPALTDEGRIAGGSGAPRYEPRATVGADG